MTRKDRYWGLFVRCLKEHGMWGNKVFKLPDTDSTIPFAWQICLLIGADIQESPLTLRVKMYQSYIYKSCKDFNMLWYKIMHHQKVNDLIDFFKEEYGIKLLGRHIHDIKQMLNGNTAIPFIIASILNQFPKTRMSDYKEIVNKLNHFYNN